MNVRNSRGMVCVIDPLYNKSLSRLLFYECESVSWPTRSPWFHCLRLILMPCLMPYALCLASSILLAWWRLIIKPESVLWLQILNSQACASSSVGLASSPKGRAERLFRFGIICQVVRKVVILDLVFRESNQEAKLSFSQVHIHFDKHFGKVGFGPKFNHPIWPNNT